VGYWNKSSLASNSGTSRRFDPKMLQSQAHTLRGRWNEAISRAKKWLQGGS
jgi:glycerol kinase